MNTGEVSRRDLLFGGFLRRLSQRPSSSETVASPGAMRRARLIPVHRPPGALPESAFMEACDRCGDCIKACPHGALKLAGRRLRSAAGTPVVDATNQPCLMCADTPCITACGPGALSPEAPMAMGTASIDPFLCLAFQHSFCTTCGERCPVPGAITVEQGRPTINPEACTGCGVCQFVCPAPANAVRLSPRRPQ